MTIKETLNKAFKNPIIRSFDYILTLYICNFAIKTLLVSSLSVWIINPLVFILTIIMVLQIIGLLLHIAASILQYIVDRRDAKESKE